MVKSLQEEFTELLQPALQIAEVSKVMGKSKCLVKEEHSKKIVEIDSKIDQKELVPNARGALDPTDH
jgi:ATP-dependent 26S proteasome regulatory subunit